MKVLSKFERKETVSILFFKIPIFFHFLCLFFQFSCHRFFCSIVIALQLFFHLIVIVKTVEDCTKLARFIMFKIFLK
jgi:hypothetical protein